MSPYIVRGEYPDDHRVSVRVYLQDRDGRTTLAAEGAHVFQDVHEAGQWQARLNEEDPAADWTTVDLHDAARIVRNATMQVHDTALMHGWSLDHRPNRFDPTTRLSTRALFHAAEPGETHPPE